VFNPGVSVDFLPQPSVVELPPELEQVECVAEEIGVGNLEPVVLPTVLQNFFSTAVADGEAE
jgi:hypothetical protein